MAPQTHSVGQGYPTSQWLGAVPCVGSNCMSQGMPPSPTPDSLLHHYMVHIDSNPLMHSTCRQPFLHSTMCLGSHPCCFTMCMGRHLPTTCTGRQVGGQAAPHFCSPNHQLWAPECYAAPWGRFRKQKPKGKPRGLQTKSLQATCSLQAASWIALV